MAFLFRRNQKIPFMDGWATKLVTKHIDGLHEAAAAIGEQNWDPRLKHKQTPLVLIPQRSCKFYLTIPEGMNAVVEENGKYVGIWTSGFHMASPMRKVSHLVSKQFVVYDTPVKECPTLDNVMVEIDVSVTFHIKDSPQDVQNFVYKLGPERLEQMLKAFQEEAVRTMARKKTYQRIYDLMDTEEFDDLKADTDDEEEKPAQPTYAGQSPVPAIPESKSMATSRIELTTMAAPLPGQIDGDLQQPQLPDDDDDDDNHYEQLENTKRAMNEKLGSYGVEVYSITITNVKLPHNFAQEMETATTFVSQNARQKMKQTHDLTVITDKERREQLEQKLREDREEKDSHYLKLQADEKKLFAAVQADTSKSVAEIKEAHAAEVLTINTDSNLKVTKLAKQVEISKAEITAKANAEARRLRAETAASVRLTEAKAEADVAAIRAESVRVKADAEALAAAKLVAKRDFDKKMAQLRTLRNLAANKKLVLSGSNQDSVVAQMLAAREGGALVGLNAGRP